MPHIASAEMRRAGVVPVEARNSLSHLMVHCGVQKGLASVGCAVRSGSARHGLQVGSSERAFALLQYFSMIGVLSVYVSVLGVLRFLFLQTHLVMVMYTRLVLYTKQALQRLPLVCHGSSMYHIAVDLYSMFFFLVRLVLDVRDRFLIANAYSCAGLFAAICSFLLPCLHGNGGQQAGKLIQSVALCAAAFRWMQVSFYLHLVPKGFYIFMSPLCLYVAGWHAPTQQMCYAMSVSPIIVTLFCLDSGFRCLGVVSLVAAILCPLFPPRMAKSEKAPVRAAKVQRKGTGFVAAEAPFPGLVSANLRVSCQLARGVAPWRLKSSIDMRRVELCSPCTFVPSALKGRLLECYGGNVSELEAILLQPWVAEIALWQDYVRDSNALLEGGAEAGDTDTSLRPVLDEYVARFAQLVLQNSTDVVGLVSDAERRAESLAIGKRIGSSDIGNNCLVHSLLQVLTLEHGVLKLDAVSDDRLVKSLCMECRAALVSLPCGDLRRPVARSPAGMACSLASDAEHDAAYLQAEMHAAFIANFLLSRVGIGGATVRAPLIIREYSRLDHVLGSPQGTTILLDPPFGHTHPHERLFLEIFNLTGSAHSGYHYEPVFSKYVLPPPVPVGSRPGGSKRRKVQKPPLVSESEVGGEPVTIQPREKCGHAEPDVFQISCLSGDASPDPRVVLDYALESLAECSEKIPRYPRIRRTQAMRIHRL